MVPTSERAEGPRRDRRRAGEEHSRGIISEMYEGVQSTILPVAGRRPDGGIVNG
jgi:hypothetical protein